MFLIEKLLLRSSTKWGKEIKNREKENRWSKNLVFDQELGKKTEALRWLKRANREETGKKRWFMIIGYSYNRNYYIKIVLYVC